MKFSILISDYSIGIFTEEGKKITEFRYECAFEIKHDHFHISLTDITYEELTGIFKVLDLTIPPLSSLEAIKHNLIK